MEAKEVCQNYSYSRVHLPFCIRILKNIKKRTETLYQSFSPFMASYAYFDTKRKIKRHPEIGCIFRLCGCKMRKGKRIGLFTASF